jgi:hypothetical protein
LDVVRRSRADVFRKTLACRELSASAIACLPDRAIVALIPAERIVRAVGVTLVFGSLLVRQVT